jgi:hypothetical protein
MFVGAVEFRAVREARAVTHGNGKMPYVSGSSLGRGQLWSQHGGAGRSGRLDTENLEIENQ